MHPNSFMENSSIVRVGPILLDLAETNIQHQLISPFFEIQSFALNPKKTVFLYRLVSSWDFSYSES